MDGRMDIGGYTTNAPYLEVIWCMGIQHSRFVVRGVFYLS